MTVTELIQRLSAHKPDAIVVIEVNHDEHVKLKNCRIVAENITEERGVIQIASEESKNVENALVIIV